MEKTNQQTFKRIPPRCYKIYEYLKKNCVGQANAQNGRTIANQLRLLYPDEFGNDYSTIKPDIKILRNHFRRKIGSTSQIGYWLMTSEDEVNGQQYAINNCLSAIETLVASGIKKEVFYRFLNGLKNDAVADNQVRLQVTPDTEEVTHVLSDDLL